MAKATGGHEAYLKRCASFPAFWDSTSLAIAFWTLFSSSCLSGACTRGTGPFVGDGRVMRDCRESGRQPHIVCDHVHSFRLLPRLPILRGGLLHLPLLVLAIVVVWLLACHLKNRTLLSTSSRSALPPTSLPPSPATGGGCTVHYTRKQPTSSLPQPSTVVCYFRQECRWLYDCVWLGKVEVKVEVQQGVEVEGKPFPCAFALSRRLNGFWIRLIPL